MHDRPDPRALLFEYVQADGPSRCARFPGFLGALRALARDEGDAAARDWARRAVSPSLDYSSLQALRRYLAPVHDGSAGLRLAILGGPTTVQLRQLIEVFLGAEGIAAEIYEADYGLFRHEILAPESGLNAFQPQVVLLATSARDVARYPTLECDEAGVAALAEQEATEWAHLWETANARWGCTVVLNNLEIAPSVVLGHYALRHPAARTNYLERLNRLIAERAPAYVVLHDLRGLAAEAGARDWFDPRFALEFKMPCGPECLVGYAHSVASLLRAILGRSRKVLVLDLDNTLWGGVVGDVGAGGIRLGEGSGEGEAYLAFQRFARALRERGVLLAVCSKNDEGAARAPFVSRPDMVLKLADFACFVANWENKADNLREIARRLNLGLDAIVFADDNPAERALVRRYLPEVAVPDLPEDPADYIGAIARDRYFETVGFTREDVSRARYYAEDALRQELAARSVDLDAFLASLGMRMRVEPVHELNIERVAQLVNKSNQFNLTTRRYTTAQLRELAADPDCHTLTFSLSDRLGDNGLINVIFLRRQADALAIDTWVMSCRVLQRGVERFARDQIAALARALGQSMVTGIYIPTPKNSMVADHYARLGFEPAGADGAQTLWTLPINDALQPLAHHIAQESAGE